MTDEQRNQQSPAPEEKEPSAEEKQKAADLLTNYVASKIKKGVPKNDIATKLEESGFERKDALKYISDMELYIKQVEETERFEESRMLPAVLG